MTAEFVLEGEAPDHEKGFPHDVAGHFGVALETVGEDNRYLDDFQSLAP